MPLYRLTHLAFGVTLVRPTARTDSNREAPLASSFRGPYRILEELDSDGMAVCVESIAASRTGLYRKKSVRALRLLLGTGGRYCTARDGSVSVVSAIAFELHTAVGMLGGLEP